MNTHAAIGDAVRIASGIAGFVDEFVDLRHDLHKYPKLAFKETRTSAKVASLLADWGYEVAMGVGGTGVIGTLRRGEGRALGIRADMDALPIGVRAGLTEVETEAAAASDNLSTITPASTIRQGDIIILKPFNGGHTVVVKNGTGNIICGADHTMDNASDMIMLIWFNNFWLKVSLADNGA